MTLKILDTTSPILQTQAERVTVFDKALRRWCEELQRGRGQLESDYLTSQQFGDSRAIAVVNNNLILINPVIESHDGVIFANEICVSHPNRQNNIRRYATIMVKYQDLAGNYKFHKAVGINAATIQHALDHLHGLPTPS